MKPYGARLPLKHRPTWPCPCCRQASAKHPRAQENAWTEELIREQLDSEPVNACDAGLCDECNRDDPGRPP